MSRQAIPVLAKSIIGLPASEEFELFYDSENSYHLTGVKNISGVKVFYDYEDPSGGDQGMLAPARLASIGNIDLSIAPATYDGIAAVQGDRIFVNDQIDPIENGVYIFDVAGDPLVRATDFDSSTTPVPVAGMLIVVTEGNTLADTLWELASDNPIVIGTDPINFDEVSVSLLAWKLDGNLEGAEKFIGTLDNFDFPVRVNNREALRVIKGASTALTKIGIGQGVASAKLDIKGAGNTNATSSLIIRDSLDVVMLNISDDHLASLIGIDSTSASFTLDIKNSAALSLLTQRNDGQFALGGGADNFYNMKINTNANFIGGLFIDNNIRTGYALELNSSVGNGAYITAPVNGNALDIISGRSQIMGIVGIGSPAEVAYSLRVTTDGVFATDSVVRLESTAVVGTINGLDINMPAVGAQNQRGIFIDVSGGANNYAIVTLNGNSGFGTITPDPNAIVEMVSTTQALLITRLDEANIVTPVNGMIIYNSVTNKFRGYENGAWVDFV